MRGAGSLLLRLCLLLTVVAAGTYLLLCFSPVDPVRAYIGNDLLHVPPAQQALIARRWGLDQPLWLRFARWAGQALQGEWGYSSLYNAPVRQVIAERLPTSLSLLAGAWLLSGLGGVALGLLAGRYHGRWPDRLLRRLIYLMACLPTFWVALLLLALLAVAWPVLPVCCAWPVGIEAEQATLTDRLRHLILPLLSLSLIGMGNVAMHTRERVVEVLASEFVLYARAQGDGGWSLLRGHVLRHALGPALCLQFASFGEFIGGALLAEKVFAYPGLGQASVDAGLRGDIPLLMALVLLCTLLVFAGNQLAGWLLRRLNRPLVLPHVA